MAIAARANDGMIRSRAARYIRDELASGKVQARMNVIHEAGLFQGRLGFKKAHDSIHTTIS
jgi:hypothetical protein